MSKILKSSAIVLVALAAVGGATYSFFSDTETSTGNTFTAGEIDLKVDSQAHYAGLICKDTGDFAYKWQLENVAVPTTRPDLDGQPCSGSWTLSDLGPKYKFFNLGDIKPGDEGENTISLHITSNPAWACIDVALTKNDDVSSTEPELAVPDAADVPANLFDGELAQNIKFAAWLDQGNTPGWQNSDANKDNDDSGEGDNKWQGCESAQNCKEPLLFSNKSGPASDVLGGKTYALADVTTPGASPLTPGQTNYIGLQWCAGTQTVGTNSITCDGSTLGNIVQTDMMEADVTFRVEQARNNPNFRCVREETPVVTKLTLAKTVIPAEVVPDSAFTLTATGPTNISGIEGNVAVTNATVTPGVYTLTESAAGPGGEVLTWSCTGNATPEVGNSVTIAAGESVVCEATNTYTL